MVAVRSRGEIATVQQPGRRRLRFTRLSKVFRQSVMLGPPFAVQSITASGQTRRSGPVGGARRREQVFWIDRLGRRGPDCDLPVGAVGQHLRAGEGDLEAGADLGVRIKQGDRRADRHGSCACQTRRKSGRALAAIAAPTGSDSTM